MYNIRTLTENIKFNRTSFSGLFCSGCKVISYLPTVHVYYIYPTVSQSPKQVPNCLKNSGNTQSFVIIVFNGVLCEVLTNTIALSHCRSTLIRYQKSLIRSMTK